MKLYGMSAMLLCTLWMDVDSHDHDAPPTGGRKNLLRAGSLFQDIDHIKEDFLGIFGFLLPKVMTKDEVKLSYFLLHDYDKNEMLDGLELLAAIHHTHENERNSSDTAESASHDRPPVLLDNSIHIIDTILKEDDKNNDGYLSYDEYSTGISSWIHKKD